VDGEPGDKEVIPPQSADIILFQDLDSLLERTGLEEEVGSGDAFSTTSTTTTSTPATAANTVLHSEVPRMFAW
jgi:hypothetical protein